MPMRMVRGAGVPDVVSADLVHPGPHQTANPAAIAAIAHRNVLLVMFRLRRKM